VRIVVYLAYRCGIISAISRVWGVGMRQRACVVPPIYCARPQCLCAWFTTLLASLTCTLGTDLVPGCMPTVAGLKIKFSLHPLTRCSNRGCRDVWESGSLRLERDVWRRKVLELVQEEIASRSPCPTSGNVITKFWCWNIPRIWFLSHDAMYSAAYSVVRCLSVCLSRLCIALKRWNEKTYPQTFFTSW